MKFKTLFIFFNIVITVSFVYVFLLPFFILGWGYVRIFWAENWYLALLFLAVIAGLNIYFLRNRKLFSLLESEDWQSVRAYLENLVYTKKKESRQTLRLLIHTYIVLADTRALAKLSRYLEDTASKYFGVFALELGIPYMVGKDTEAMRAYFERAVAEPAARKKDWLRWNAAFAGLACPESETRKAAALGLTELASGGGEPVLRLLSAYLLDTAAEKSDNTAKLPQSVRADFRRAYTKISWEKSAARFKASLTGLVLKQVLGGAEAWLFEETNT